MGWLTDLFFGSKPDVTRKTEQDNTMEEQKRYIDEPDWKNYSWGQATTAPAPEQAAQDPYRTSSGEKIRPEVEIERVKSDLSSNSDHVDVWITLKNLSEFDVEVSRINFLGRNGGGGYFLKPGEAREVRVYSGDTPKNDAYHDANVQYKVTGNGDYFQADHYLQFHFEQTEHGNFYVPEECKLTRPIRDI